jgi:hypothetical protein
MIKSEHKPEPFFRGNQVLWMEMGKERQSFLSARLAGEHLRRVLLEKRQSITKPVWIDFTYGNIPGVEVNGFQGKDHYIQLYWGDKGGGPVPGGTYGAKGHAQQIAGAFLTDIDRTAFEFGLMMP